MLQIQSFNRRAPPYSSQLRDYWNYVIIDYALAGIPFLGQKTTATLNVQDTQTSVHFIFKEQPSID